MKVVEVHTCPVWKEPDGSRRIGFDQELDAVAALPVVGWCNVLVIETASGARHRLLLAHAEDFE